MNSIFGKGKAFHKTTSIRRIITVGELASYFGVHRNTMRKRIEEYGLLDFYNIISILDFAKWCLARERGVDKVDRV